MAQARVGSSYQNLHVREAQPVGLRHFGLWIAVTLILKASNTTMCGCLLPSWRLIYFILPQALIIDSAQPVLQRRCYYFRTTSPSRCYQNAGERYTRSGMSL